MNKKNEIKTVCSIRLSKSQKEEILRFGKGSLTDGVSFILDYILDKNQNVIQNDIKRNTFGNENVIQNQEVKMNDKMQVFLGKFKVDVKRYDDPIIDNIAKDFVKKQISHIQSLKLKEYKKYKEAGLNIIYDRESGEEISYSEFANKYGILDFI